jgi:hypothetical protein
VHIAVDEPISQVSKSPKRVRYRSRKRTIRWLDRWSRVISCLSLAVATGSAYYQQLRISHSVLCGVVRVEMSAQSLVGPPDAPDTSVEGEVLIENVGNRNEAIYNIAYNYVGAIRGGYVAGPIVVKSGEVKLIPFKATVDVAPINFNAQKFGIDVDVFQADGRERFTTIRYDAKRKVRDIMLIGTVH